MPEHPFRYDLAALARSATERFKWTYAQIFGRARDLGDGSECRRDPGHSQRLGLLPPA